MNEPFTRILQQRQTHGVTDLLELGDFLNCRLQIGGAIVHRVADFVKNSGLSRNRRKLYLSNFLVGKNFFKLLSDFDTNTRTSAWVVLIEEFNNINSTINTLFAKLNARSAKNRSSNCHKHQSLRGSFAVSQFQIWFAIAWMKFWQRPHSYYVSRTCVWTNRCR